MNKDNIKIAGENDEFLRINPEGESQEKYGDDDVVWERTPKVYIDSYGRFVTNALKESSIGIAPGYVDAFGEPITSLFWTNY